MNAYSHLPNPYGQTTPYPGPNPYRVSVAAVPAPTAHPAHQYPVTQTHPNAVLYPDARVHGAAQVVYVVQQPVQAPPAEPVYAHTMRKQSIKTHALLAVTTAGLGNVLYAKAAKSKTAAKYKW